MVERSDRMWSTGEEGNGKPLQYSCLENPMNSMKRQNDRILKEELPRSVRAQYATRDQWRNNPTSGSSIIWELVRNAHSWAPPRSTESETLGVGHGQGGLTYCDSWGLKESDMTELN